MTTCTCKNSVKMNKMKTVLPVALVLELGDTDGVAWLEVWLVCKPVVEDQSTVRSHKNEREHVIT